MNPLIIIDSYLFASPVVNQASPVVNQASPVINIEHDSINELLEAFS